MKKSLSLILALAMVFSMFASVVSADTAATTAATSVTATTYTPQQAFDMLKAAGIVTGDADKGANLEANMTRAEFSKVIAMLWALPENAAGSTVYTDLKGASWAAGYIGAATKAGLLNGVGGGKFNPSGNVKLEEIAKVVATGFKLPAVTYAGTGKISTWSKGYVGAVIAAKLIADSADFTVAAKRSELFTISLTGYTAIEKAKVTPTPTPTPTPGVLTQAVTVTGAKTLLVKFNQAVDTAKAVLTVKNGTSAVNVLSTTFAEDKKSATLKFSNSLIAADYTVTVTGASTDPVTATVTVAAEKVSKITFASDKAVLAAGSATEVTVGFSVKNQYEEDVTSTTGLTFTASKGTAVGVASTGVVTITTTGTYAIGDALSLSAIDPTTSTFATTALVVAASASVSSVVISQLYNTNDKTVAPVAGKDATDFKLILVATDQYGNKIAAGNGRGDVIITNSNPTVAGIPADTTPFTTTSIDGTSYTSLALTGTLTAGTTKITVISKTTGKIVSFDVVVKDVSKIDTFVVTAPTIAVAGEKVTIPFTAVDQYGKAITDAAVLNAAGAFLSAPTVGSGTTSFVQDYVKGTASLVVDGPLFTTGPKILTAVTSTNKVVQLSITYVAAAVPTVIVGLTANVKKALLSTNGTTTLSNADTTVNDQYGRAITPTLGSTAGKYRISVTSSDATKVAVSAANITDVVTTVTLSSYSASTVGSSDITLKLQKTDGTTFTDVANSSFTWTEKVVDKAAIVSYQVSDIAKLYQKQTSGALDVAGSAAYEQAITVNGVLADGSLVTIPAVLANYSVSSAVYNSATGKLNGAKGTLITDGVDKTASVAVTVIGNTGAVVISKTVTYSSAAPKVASYTLKTVTNVGTLESAGIISADDTLVNTQDDINALALSVVKTLDQYGVELIKGAEEVIGQEFQSTIVTNFSAHAIGTLVAGDTANVTLISPDNTIVLTFKLIVK